MIIRINPKRLDEKMTLFLSEHRAEPAKNRNEFHVPDETILPGERVPGPAVCFIRENIAELAHGGDVCLIKSNFIHDSLS